MLLFVGGVFVCLFVLVGEIFLKVLYINIVCFSVVLFVVFSLFFCCCVCFVVVCCLFFFLFFFFCFVLLLLLLFVLFSVILPLATRCLYVQKLKLQYTIIN